MLNTSLIELSDILTFHNYDDHASLVRQIAQLKALGRPVVCTEWMSRTRNSLLRSHLPTFWEEKVGCYFWGLVNGKTQTHLPWTAAASEAGEPLWFHDLLDLQGAAYRPDELEVIRMYIQRERSRGSRENTALEHVPALDIDDLR